MARLKREYPERSGEKKTSEERTEDKRKRQSLK